MHRLFDDLEEHSRSDKSCDTVICVDPSGCVLLNEEVRGSQEFVPIIPSLQRSKADFKGTSFIKRCELLKSISPSTPKKDIKKQPPQQKPFESSTPDLECLKCNTFAELQNRLGCIDGSDVVGVFPCKDQPISTVVKPESHLSKAAKIPAGQPNIPGSSAKNETNEKGIRYHIQGDTHLTCIEEIPCRHTDQAKSAERILNCSRRPDIVSCSVQSEQAAGSQSLTETMDMPLSLALPMEGTSSDDSTLPSETRISPVGKSSSSSFSAGLGSPVSLPVTISEGIPQFSTDNQREMKATITVTVQQPLDLNGHDELIYSVVEEVTINGGVNQDKAAVVTSTTGPNSLEKFPSGSKPVRIINSVGEEQTAVDSVSQVQALKEICKAPSVRSAGKAIPLVQNTVVSSQDDSASHIVTVSEESQNIIEDEAACGSPYKDEVTWFEKNSCEIIPEQKATKRKCNQGNGLLSREISGSCSPVNQRKLDDFKMDIPETRENSNTMREWNSLGKLCDSQDSLYHGMNPFSPRATLGRKKGPVNLSHLEWEEESESLSSGKESDRDRSTKRRGRQPQPIATKCLEFDRPASDNMHSKSNKRSPIEESSKLFSAKLEQLANRNRCLGTSHLESFDLQSFEESNTLFTRGPAARFGGYCTSPRFNRRHLEQSHCMTLGSKWSLDRDYASAQAKSMTSPCFRDVFDEDLAVSRTSCSFKRVPGFFPLFDFTDGDTAQPSKPSQSNISAGGKLLSSPKVCKMSGTSPKNSCISLKPVRKSISRSSSLSPDGLSIKQISWSSQSLSRKQGKAIISPKTPRRALNGRIEWLRESRDSLSGSSLGSLDVDELDEVSKGKTNSLTHTLPSPYSRITAPRKPNHCSGHASDNTSVLSGELPPAMCKTALLYNRNSMVSSGYESMVRDSEATCSSTSIHDSISDQSRFVNAPKGARGCKKKNNIGKLRVRTNNMLVFV